MEKNLVLVLDDHQSIRQLLMDALTPAYCVYGAADVLEATELIQAKQFALLIIDLQLPIVTGTEFIQIIRSFSEYDGLPIVAISAYPRLLHQLDTQVLIVLQKPFNLAEFKELVAAIVPTSPDAQDVQVYSTGKRVLARSPNTWSYANLVSAKGGKMDNQALVERSRAATCRSAELRQHMILLRETMHELYGRQRVLLQEMRSLSKRTST